MIHAFSVQNYKSLKTNKINLSPLTILSGINNTGKTTFIQSILELARYQDEYKRFSSNPLLSNFKTKVLNNSTDHEIKFHMQIDLTSDTFIQIDISFKYDENLKSGFPTYCKIFKKHTDYESILEISKNIPTEPYKIYSDRGLNLLFGRVKEKATLPRIFEGIGDFEFIGNIPFQCQLKFKENPQLEEWFEKKDDNDNINLSVKAGDSILDSCLDVKYIGPLRNHPKEFYFFENRGLSIDSRGENTFEVLDRLANNKIKFYKDIEDTELFELSLIDSVKYWIDYFYKGTTFEIDSISNDLVRILINGHSIKHSGFGYSQILPIIVRALLLKKNELLLLEQPEIHLHPELEYKLAYFLLCITKNNRQIIAETHSEHIVNKLIISKMKDTNIKKVFNIYFLKKDSHNITNFEDIVIGDYGEVENWPKGFFDQYLDFTKELVTLRKEKALRQQKLNVRD